MCVWLHIVRQNGMKFASSNTRTVPRLAPDALRVQGTPYWIVIQLLVSGKCLDTWKLRSGEVHTNGLQKVSDCIAVEFLGSVSSCRSALLQRFLEFRESKGKESTANRLSTSWRVWQADFPWSVSKRSTANNLFKSPMREVFIFESRL